MTDEEYLFRRDIANKKATTRSAARRVSGAKSKKMHAAERLPLSGAEKEIKRGGQNGEYGSAHEMGGV